MKMQLQGLTDLHLISGEPPTYIAFHGKKWLTWIPTTVNNKPIIPEN
jgi:hypothetical protein